MNITCKVKCDEVASKTVKDDDKSLLDGRINGNKATAGVAMVPTIPRIVPKIPRPGRLLIALYNAKAKPPKARIGKITALGAFS